MPEHFIDQIDIFKSPIPLKEPFIISLGPLFSADNLFVRIRTNTGLEGWGESSPFRTIHGESQDTGFVVGQYLAKAVLGKDPTKISDCILAMDRAIFGNASIKSAFDLALYDLASRDAGVPLFQFLGGKPGRNLFTDYTVSLGPPEKMASDAKTILDRGFQAIKVKLGGIPDEDVERMRQIRNAVGMEIPIRIDANQGWTAESAPELLRNLFQFNLQFCEEPIPRQEFMKLPGIRKNSPVPIMADESCCDPHDAERLISLNACDMLNVKLGKSGGIFKALKIIRLAENAGLPVQLGGFLESRLGFTAAAHLAHCSETIQFIDFDTPLMFSQDPVLGGIRYDEVGTVFLPEGNGLGAEVDPDYLKGLECISIPKK
jgi:L-alanine-DL-glutamate epimerase-like enolase superfamily enzyme